jgi:hypothetical protein
VVTRIFSQDVILDFPAIYYRRSPRHSLRNTNFLISRAIPVPLIAGVSPRTATAPQPENLVEHSLAVSKSGGDGSNTSKIVADEVPLPQGELTVGAPDPGKSSSTENELLGRAIGMIRSALEKGSE